VREDEIGDLIRRSLLAGISRTEIRRALKKRGLSEVQIDEAMLSKAHIKQDPSRELSVDIDPLAEEAERAQQELAQAPLSARVFAAKVELHEPPKRVPRKITNVDEVVDLGRRRDGAPRLREERLDPRPRGAQLFVRVVQFAVPVLAMVYILEVGFPTVRKWLDRITHKTVESAKKVSSELEKSVVSKEATQPARIPAENRLRKQVKPAKMNPHTRRALEGLEERSR
jgi:hypothetical protein